MDGKTAPEPLLTVEEVAEYLKVSAGSIYNRVSKGEIPFVKIGTSVRFRRSEIDRWVEEQAGRPSDPTPAQGSSAA